MIRGNSIVLKCIHVVLSRKSNPDGSIDRKKLFEILAETYHIPKEDRFAVARELQRCGVIVDNDKFTYTVKKLRDNPIEQF